MGYIPPRPPPGDDTGKPWQPLPWKAWFSWHPITTVSGRRYWFKTVYRRYTHENGGGIEYGDSFDVLIQ
jgi:hypothetical protein